MKTSALDRAIEQLDGEIAVLELVKIKLVAQKLLKQKAPKRPRIVAAKDEKVG